ncbi:GSCOCG00007820001-RA-CDS [Cotesia congregata]|nr:GSCOCG00007820001-RA-CDS [Cotesia congregata]
MVLGYSRYCYRVGFLLPFSDEPSYPNDEIYIYLKDNSLVSVDSRDIK